MDEYFASRILEKVKLARTGIWISEIAKQLECKESKVRYYIYGRTQNNRFFGGFDFLRNEIVDMGRQGKNRMVIYRRYVKQPKSTQETEKKPEIMTEEKSEQILREAGMFK